MYILPVHLFCCILLYTPKGMCQTPKLRHLETIWSRLGHDLFSQFRNSQGVTIKPFINSQGMRMFCH